MILARLTAAIRAQNWFAVLLEFVIVVAGVLLAFQVSAWNAARIEQAAEAAYMARLHDEVLEAEASRVGQLEIVAARLEDAEAVIEVIFDGRNPDTLPSSACTSLARLSIFYLESHALPTLDELTATGALETIRDAELRDALNRYRSLNGTHDRFSTIHDSKPALSQAYPELIQNRPYYGESGIVRPEAAACDWEAMRAHAGFRNDLLDLAGRAGFFVRYALAVERTRFEAVHTALDRALGPQTSEGSTP